MRKLPLWTLAAAVLISWCAPVGAAEEKTKHVPQDGAVQVILLRHKSVRDDLKLTEDENKQIHAFTDGQWKKALAADNLGPKERDELFDKLTAENEAFLKKLLEPEQHKRLTQITLQVAGLLWITRPEISSELNLTEEQRNKAFALQKEALDEMADLLHSTTTRDRHEKLKELHETSRKRLYQLLTDEQEVTWKKMIGAHFRGHLRFDEDRPGEPSDK